MRLPLLRTLPSRTYRTSSCFATSRTSTERPLNAKLEWRAMTLKPANFDSDVRMSSTRPSQKYCWSASPLMSSNGSTAIEGISRGRGAAPLAGLPRHGRIGRCCRAVQHRAKGAHRPGDVLEVFLSKIDERGFNFAVHVVEEQCRKLAPRPARIYPSSRAAILTPSPRMSSPSISTSPRLTPMR